MRQKIKWLAWFGVILLLIYTRTVNLSWGLPLPFHPDERNMAVALQQLTCPSFFDLKECFNPHFFAYGQLPIYLGYLLVFIGRLNSHMTGEIRFDEATIALRFISAVASILTVYLGILIVSLFTRRFRHLLLTALLLIFTPGLIQFSHFGTTESLLILLYTLIVYLCLKLAHLSSSEYDRHLGVIGMVSGLAIAVKISAISFLLLPFICIAALTRRHRDMSRYEKIWQYLNECIYLVFIAGSVALLTTPHLLISWNDFIGSIQYEGAVATGAVQVFYTWTFQYSVPLLQQFRAIFPYVFGVPLLVLMVLGIILLPKTGKYSVLRLSFVLFFVIWSFAYTKWTRFMAPLLPVAVVLASLMVMQIEGWVNSHVDRRAGVWLTTALCAVAIVPGCIFLRVYQQDDVRLTASQWMQKNIPRGSVVLQETANVVDLPILPHPTTNISFNFYELDQSVERQKELKQALQKATYIVIPTRRIFYNYWCPREDLQSTDQSVRNRCKDLRRRFRKLNNYYDRLFSGSLGFKRVAEFRVLDDERAEETWTVFDHPVIRVYKKM